MNGEERTRADLRALDHPWPELVAHASRNTRFARATCSSRWPPKARAGRFAPGDVVELEADGIGVLRNRVA